MPLRRSCIRVTVLFCLAVAVVAASVCLVPCLAVASPRPSAPAAGFSSAFSSSPLSTIGGLWRSLVGSAAGPTAPAAFSTPSAAHASLRASDYAVSSLAPSYLPAARLRCDLVAVDGGSHRAVSLQLGSPAQTLRLLVDTGSSDLLALNASYCQRSPSAARSCFNPSNAGTTVLPAAFVLPAYSDDGEVLSDSSAHAALALANLPVQLAGTNLTLLLGATDVTMQDALLGYASAGTRQVSIVLSSPQAVFVPPVPTASFPYSVQPVNSIADVDGLLGMAYGPLSALGQLQPAYSSAFLAITQATQTQSQSALFALDFSDNKAYIGGIQERYRDALQWSYSGALGLESYHSFSLWDVGVCGANLQRGVLQGVQALSALVDTGSACLSLPAELFDAVVSWLPVACSDAADGTQQGQSTAAAIDPSLLGGNAAAPVSPPAGSPYAANPGSASNVNPHVRYCWLAADLLAPALPTLSFRMAQPDPSLPDDSPLQPPKLFIPLADLLLGPARTSPTSAVAPQRLCLYRTGSLFASGGGAPVLSFGSRALLSLHAVFAMASHQVAFANVGGVGGSNASCVAAVHCAGQQTVDATYNVCVDPACSSYYFFSLNAATHRCELASGFHVLAALLIALLALSEVGLNEWLIRISRRVQGLNNHDKQHSAQHARRRRRQASAAVR